MISLIKRFFQMRIIRYGLVGGIGIPIQDGASFLFVRLLGQSLFPLADALAFLVSNFINFTLNQFFTYKEQVKGIHGWDWMRRYFKGQLT
ncbi:MAG TPA: GtrA family protein, partial [Ktedonobacteraceae bacterium]|nr:GtrA family protein [Ktedonobacteraceae bacterium]